MKKILILALVLQSFTLTLQARQLDRLDQVRQHFLKLANSKGSDIEKALTRIRSQAESDECSGDCNFQRKLSEEDIQVVLTRSEVSFGQATSQDTASAGYELLTYEIFVPVTSVSPGGRLELMETKRFVCTRATENYGVLKAEILCQEK